MSTDKYQPPPPLVKLDSLKEDEEESYGTGDRIEKLENSVAALVSMVSKLTVSSSSPAVPVCLPPAEGKAVEIPAFEGMDDREKVERLLKVNNSNIAKVFPETQGAAELLSGPEAFARAAAALPDGEYKEYKHLPSFLEVTDIGGSRRRMPLLPANFSASRLVDANISFKMSMAADGTTVWKPDGGAQTTLKRTQQQLLKLLPDWFSFENAWMSMLKALNDAGELTASDLPALRLHMSVLRAIAKRMSSSAWGIFLEMQQDLAVQAHNSGWALDRDGGYVDNFTVMSYLAKAAAIGAGGSSGTVGGGAAGSGGGGSKHQPSTQQPAAIFRSSFRADGKQHASGACYAFQDFGSCPYGPSCKWSASHRCSVCDSTTHGTNQCSHAPKHFNKFATAGGGAGGSGMGGGGKA